MRIFRLLFALAAIATVLVGCQSAGPVISGYESHRGVNYKQRSAAHAGVDFAGKHGEPIIAAADGVVSSVFSINSRCGKGVSLYHRDVFRAPAVRFPDVLATGTYTDNIYTVYCHMSKIADFSSPFVSRGDVIGYVGISGDAGGVPHVHFVVSEDGAGHRDGDLQSTRNPSDYLVGCYDPAKTYSTDKHVLTFPLSCK